VKISKISFLKVLVILIIVQLIAWFWIPLLLLYPTSKANSVKKMIYPIKNEGIEIVNSIKLEKNNIEDILNKTLYKWKFSLKNLSNGNYLK